MAVEDVARDLIDLLTNKFDTALSNDLEAAISDFVAGGGVTSIDGLVGVVTLATTYATLAAVTALQAELDDHIATPHAHPDLATHLAMGLDATD